MKKKYKRRVKKKVRRGPICRKLNLEVKYPSLETIITLVLKIVSVKQLRIMFLIFYSLFKSIKHFILIVKTKNIWCYFTSTWATLSPAATGFKTTHFTDENCFLTLICFQIIYSLQKFGNWKTKPKSWTNSECIYNFSIDSDPNDISFCTKLFGKLWVQSDSI